MKYSIQYLYPKRNTKVNINPTKKILNKMNRRNIW